MPDKFKFTLSINLGNDAMQTREEVAEALERVAGTLRASSLPEDTQHIRDANGNAVGRWEFATRKGDES